MATGEPSHIAVQVGGSFTGQLAAGSDNTQVALNINVGDAPGDTLAFLDKALGIERIAPPVDARPTAFTDLFGRDAAIAAAEAPVAPPWIGVVGPPGIGKSVLLRYLAGRWGVTRQPDGMVYLPAAGMVDLDVAYALFDLFYRTRPRGRPSRGELVSSLAAVKAVVMLDDVDDLHLADTLALMRGTTFVVAGQRSVITEGTRVALGGLDPASSVHLVERGLGRPVQPDEQADAERLVTALHGIPADILREAGDAAVEGRTLAELLAGLTGASGAGGAAGAEPPVAAAPVQVLTGDEHAVVLAAAALGGVPVGRQHLAAITGAPAAVESLERRGIVRAASPSLVLDGSWLARLSGRPELSEWHSRWLDYLAEWASAAPGTPNPATEPEEVAAEAPALAFLLGPPRFGLDRERSNALVRAVLPALTLTSRWGLRRRLLEAMMAGLDAGTEAEATGWALHQVGTQDAVEGRLTEARNNLTRALEIRRQIGDLPGFRATQQNLAVLDALAIPIPRNDVEQDSTSATGRGGLSAKWLLPLAVGVLAVAAVVAWLLVNPGGTTASISPGDVAFSTVQVGERSAAQTVRITAGTRPLRITNIGIDDVTAFQLVDSPCTGTQLEPGASCDESIVFAPTQEGAAKAALLVSTEGSDTPLRVTLHGATTAAALASQTARPPSLAPPVTPSPTPSAGPPNLVIGVLDVGRPVHETDGWHVPVSVVIANGGDSDAGLFEVALLRDVRGTDIIPFMVDGQATSVPATTAPLKPGAQTTIRGFALLPPESQGAIRIDVEADSCAIANPAHRKPCRVVETREDDNSLRSSVTLPAGPDLVVLRIDRAQASLPDPDGGVRHGSFVGVVANIGTADAGASGLQVAVTGGDAKMESPAIQEIRGLAAGQQRTIKGTFDFFYSQGPDGTPQLELTIDQCDTGAPCHVTELNEDNNTTVRPIDLPTSPGG
jgi:hypothetical protein